MMRKVIALFDEYQSKENAKHVIRSMKENARQGFWNGATAPLGYKLIEAEKRGTKIKKKLDLDPIEAETVELIFRLYLHGDGNSGALGVKVVVKWLTAMAIAPGAARPLGLPWFTRSRPTRSTLANGSSIRPRHELASASPTRKSSRFLSPA